MASNNTIKTRIQLKSDTEANWKKSVLTTDHPQGEKTSGTSFVPLSGELIVFSADTTHPFSRLKVGDGSSNVLSLPFIDSGTLNGEETEILKYSTFSAFPSPGSPTCLYVDKSTNYIYHYEASSGYTLLNDFEFQVTTDTIDTVGEFKRGSAAIGYIDNNTFTFIDGTTPSLRTIPVTVVTSITKGGGN